MSGPAGVTVAVGTPLTVLTDTVLEEADPQALLTFTL